MIFKRKSFHSETWGDEVISSQEIENIKEIYKTFHPLYPDIKTESMGLDKYQYIMKQVNSTNVATDIDFQRTFNGFLYSKAK